MGLQLGFGLEVGRTLGLEIGGFGFGCVWSLGLELGHPKLGFGFGVRICGGFRLIV